MGGRGAYLSGASRSYEGREFDPVGAVNGGRTQVFKRRSNVRNLSFPIYSNTKNTTYFVLDKKTGTRVESIALYCGHKIRRSIDLLDTRGVHFHKWRTPEDGGRLDVVKDRKDDFVLPVKYKRLVALARAWKG